MRSVLREMKRFTVAVAVVLLGCTSNPIPEGCTGPKATIRDSGASDGPSKASFYYLSAVNGKTVDESVSATRQANHGRGFQMTPKIVEREVLADRELQLTLDATVAYAAPILELANSSSMYHATQVIRFQLEPNGVYVVKGELGPDKSSVWLEDSKTNEKVGTPVAKK
jgi:hypothetical protein